MCRKHYMFNVNALNVSRHYISLTVRLCGAIIKIQMVLVVPAGFCRVLFKQLLYMFSC